MFGWKSKTNGMQRRVIETSGAYDGGFGVQTMGLMAGTHVASNLGWRAVEALAAGDKVLTFDNGMQEIVEVRRMHMWIEAEQAVRASWPVVVPKGALGNRQELTLLADQGVLVESDAAADIYGDPFAIVPAHALEGVRGIHRAAPRQQVELISIIFAEEQVIYAEGGALVHCPAVAVTLDAFLNATPGCYDVLSPRDAEFLAECIVMEDQIVATGRKFGAQMAAHC